MLPAPLLMVVCGFALNSPLVAMRGVTAAAAVALGLGFAFYLLAVRNHVTVQMRAGNPSWLTFFNNLANTSALVGFSIMAALVAASRLFRLSYSTLLAFGLSGLALTAIVGVAVYAYLE
jgi:hypothetical protein